MLFYGILVSLQVLLHSLIELMVYREMKATLKTLPWKGLSNLSNMLSKPNMLLQRLETSSRLSQSLRTEVVSSIHYSMLMSGLPGGILLNPRSSKSRLNLFCRLISSSLGSFLYHSSMTCLVLCFTDGNEWGKVTFSPMLFIMNAASSSTVSMCPIKSYFISQKLHNFDCGVQCMSLDLPLAMHSRNCWNVISGL